MVRFLGAALIFVSPVLLSVHQYVAYWRQERLLAAFSQMLGETAAQIRCNLTALPRIAFEMERRGPPLLRQFWREIGCGLAAEDVPFAVLWCGALERTALSARGAEILSAVPCALGFYRTEEITDALQKIVRALEEHRSDLRRDFQRNFRMRTGLLLSSALFLLILLF